MYKQNPATNGYFLVSELDDNLQRGYYDSPLGYNNVNCFINEVLKIENKKAFYF